MHGHLHSDNPEEIDWENQTESYKSIDNKWQTFTFDNRYLINKPRRFGNPRNFNKNSGFGRFGNTKNFNKNSGFARFSNNNKRFVNRLTNDSNRGHNHNHNQNQNQNQRFSKQNLSNQQLDSELNKYISKGEDANERQKLALDVELKNYFHNETPDNNNNSDNTNNIDNVNNNNDNNMLNNNDKNENNTNNNNNDENIIPTDPKNNINNDNNKN